MSEHILKQMEGLMKAFKDLKECEKQTTINGLNKSDEVVHNVKDEEESIPESARPFQA